jgi:hypothetical protein
MLGQYMNKQQDKNYGADPYGTALSDIKGQQATTSANLSAQTSGATPTNPNIVKMREMLMNRATTPQLTSPTVTPPARFSTPSSTYKPPDNYSPTNSINNLKDTISQQKVGDINPIQMNPPARYNPAGGAGGADTELMKNLSGLAMGQGANYQGGMAALQQSLANRFGIRAKQTSTPTGNVSGTLTPYKYGTPPTVLTPGGATTDLKVYPGQTEVQPKPWWETEKAVGGATTNLNVAPGQTEVQPKPVSQLTPEQYAMAEQVFRTGGAGALQKYLSSLKMGVL